MNVYMDVYGRYYAAPIAASPNDMTLVTPSPKLTVLLTDQPTPVRADDMKDVFAREKDEPGFIMKFVKERGLKPKDEDPAIKDK